MLKNLTQCHSGTWIIVQHVADDVKELQVFGSVVDHVAVEGFCMISNVTSPGRLFVPVQLSMIKIFCF